MAPDLNVEFVLSFKFPDWLFTYQKETRLIHLDLA
jgi:hypothetical protein